MSGEQAWLAEALRRSPAHPALVAGDVTVSYAQLADRACRRAGMLEQLGIGRGDVVGVMLHGGMGFAELLHAASARGAVLLALNLRLTPREVAFQLRDSGARLLLHDGARLTEPARAAASDADVETALVADGPAMQADGPALEADGPARPSARAARTGTCFDPASTLAIVYTSGTTGRPKGAALTHANFRASAVASARHLGAEPGDRWLACLPLYHVGGLSILLRCAWYGATAVIQDRFDADAVVRSIDREGVTLVSLTATTLARVLDARGDRPAPPRLRCVLVGGGPVPAALLERAASLGFPVAPTYGLTEATSQVATRPPRSGPPGGGGLVALPGIRVRVVDHEGRDAPAGKEGEILVAGPTVMRGYVNRPLESARVLRGGWLHTGDVGVLDANGDLRVIDRRSDLILSAGENVYPAEVEATLLEHPRVSDAAVVGIEDPAYGQRPAAWLVSRSGAAPSEDELRAFCRERLAGYKVPVCFRLTNALPRNASGKLLRGLLSRRASAAGSANDPPSDP